MANAVHSPIDFSKPRGFGFGKFASPSPSSGWPTQVPHIPLSPLTAMTMTSGPSNPLQFQHLASSISQQQQSPHSHRVAKRRLDNEEDELVGGAQTRTGLRDQSMDRSPTPERPKRAAPKRARIVPSSEEAGMKAGGVKEKAAREQVGGGDVDVGILLGELSPHCQYETLLTHSNL